MTAGINLAAVPFQEAIDFFKNKKLNIPTQKYSDLHGAMHSQAFMVAGAMQDSLLGDIRGSVQSAIENGTTIADFRQNFDATVEKHGWSYNGDRNWRTGVIFNTNLGAAYNAGRHAQQTDPDVKKKHGFLKFVHGKSIVPRAEHLAWDGTTLPIDHPWWKTHYTPLGWGCKCRVESVANAAVESGKEKLTDKPADFGTYAWKNPSTGQTHQVPVGIDPGFDYNPGMASGVSTAAMRSLEKSAGWTQLPGLTPAYYNRPAEVPADAPQAQLGPKAHNAASLMAAFTAAIGAKEFAQFTGPDGVPVVLSAAIVQHMTEEPNRFDGREQFFPFLKEVVENPFEIWASAAVNNATGKVGFRKRYVKMLEGDKKGVAVGLVADSVDNSWVALTVIRGKETAFKNLRTGNLLWGRKI
ncbi:MAG: hypothetical protein HY243_12300 [Proteobacteria bacterium]|nr:hypothetical protein [Pseudomonadota bacterium]